MDLVIHTVNGLTVEYNQISATLRTRETPIEFAELHEKLMDYEIIMHGADSTTNDHILATAHATTRRKGPHQRTKSPYTPSSSSSSNTSEKRVICKFREKPDILQRYVT